MTFEKKKELYRLLNALCEDAISDSEFLRLEEIIRNDAEARTLYVDFTTIWAQLRHFQIPLSLQPKRAFGQSRPGDLCTLTDSAIWEALSRAEKESPAVCIRETPVEIKPDPVRKVEHVKVEHHISRFSIISLIASAAAMLLLVVFARYAPSGAGLEVASVVDTIDTEWIKGPQYLQSGSRLSILDGHIGMRKGFMMLEFDNHVRVTIEAPAEFSLVAKDRMQLNYGRIYASVPPEAIGFEVVTPELKVIDLGTEFGVQADVNGSAELHVIKGKTTLIAKDNNEKQSLTVDAGKAKKVHISGLNTQISEIECDEYKFARQINANNRGSVWRGQRPVAINCGNGPAYTAPDGTVFIKDKYYSGIDEGTAQLNAANARIEAPDGVLYETNRYDREFTYNIPIANGDYHVTLMFAENHFTEAGERVFDVLVEGEEVISDLDIFTASGGQNIPYHRTVPVTVQDRNITILLRADLNNAQINAIKIVPFD